MDEREKKEKVTNSNLVQVFYLEQEILTLDQNIIEEKKILETLQNELACTEVQKTAIEVLVKKHLEDTEKAKKAYTEDLTAYTNQKNSLEKQCEELSVKSEQLTNDLNVKSKELEDKIVDLAKKSKELQVMNSELKESEKQLDTIRESMNREQKRVSRKWKFAFGTVLCILLVTIIKLSDAETSYQSAEEEKKEVLAKLSDVEKYIGSVIIKVNSIYNGGENGVKLSNKLEASEMRYLTFDIDIYFLNDSVEEETIYIDIYNPDGTLNRSVVNSPVGHTFSISGTGERRPGWGNSEKSTYTSGIYRVDFIYEDMIIHSQKVEISKSNVFEINLK